jgi:hypothetical protein
VSRGGQLEIVSEMDDGGVVFGDGIEDDRLDFAWGMTLHIGISEQRLRLVRGVSYDLGSAPMENLSPSGAQRGMAPAASQWRPSPQPALQGFSSQRPFSRLQTRSPVHWP